MNQFADAFEKKGYKKKDSKPKKLQTKNPNLGWLFYKDYFFDLDYTNFQNNEINIKEKITNIINLTPSLYKNTKKLGNTSLRLTTTYPGLLLGSGYLHELPDIKGQAILGFDFDYTTGLPIIRGSSIKGVLRSAFAHKEYIKSLLKSEAADLNALEKEVFENGDIFFDAYIVDFREKLLDDDYITPHKSPLKDPTPLRFIKVAPDVTFMFEFDLNDGGIKKEEKAELFTTILLDLGLGAKTNVGYGKFL